MGNFSSRSRRGPFQLVQLSRTNFEIVFFFYRLIPEPIRQRLEQSEFYYPPAESWLTAASPEVLKAPGFELEYNPNRPRSRMIRALLDRNELYEQEVTHFVELNLKPGMTFIDVGANEGWFSMLACSILKGRGKVLSVEPNPRLGPILNRNIERNGFSGVASVTLVALGKSNGSTILFIPENDGQSSITARTSKAESVEVPLVTLDHLASGLEVNLIKIDVEGYDDEVLAGGTEVISRCRPIVIFEYNPYILFLRGRDYDRAFRALRPFNYRFHLLTPMGKHGPEVSGSKDVAPFPTNILALPQ